MARYRSKLYRFVVPILTFVAIVTLGLFDAVHLAHGLLFPGTVAIVAALPDCSLVERDLGRVKGRPAGLNHVRYRLTLVVAGRASSRGRTDLHVIVRICVDDEGAVGQAGIVFA